MSKIKLTLITKEESSSGFHLAGVEVLNAKNSSETRKILQPFLERLEPSLIAIEEDLYPFEDKKLQKHLEEKPFPVLLSLPKIDIKNMSDQQGYVSELVRSCIGYYVKLK